MPVASVGKGLMADAEQPGFTWDAYGGCFSQRQGMHGFLYRGREYLTGSRVHRGNVTVYVALHDTHRRGFYQKTEEGILFLQSDVLAAQTVQQVVEGAHNDVCFMLSRRGEPCCQIQIPHQFHASDKCIVGAYGLMVEEPEVKRHQYNACLRDVEQRRMAVESGVERYCHQCHYAQREQKKVILKLHLWL